MLNGTDDGHSLAGGVAGVDGQVELDVDDSVAGDRGLRGLGSLGQDGQGSSDGQNCLGKHGDDVDRNKKARLVVVSPPVGVDDCVGGCVGCLRQTGELELMCTGDLFYTW